MITIFLLSLAGAVIAAVVGTLWYSDATPMGKIHMKSLGFDKLSKEEQAKKRKDGMAMMPKMYAAQFGLSFLTAFSVVLVVIMSVRNGMSFEMAAGLVTFNWLCLMVPIIGGGVLWSNCDRSIAWKKFISDILENLLTVLIIAVLASFFV